MDCKCLQEQLDLYVLAALDDVTRRRVEEHLSACAACKAEADALVAFAAGFQELADPIHEEARLQRLTRHVAAETRLIRRRQSLRGNMVFVVTVAALLAVCAFIPWLVCRSGVGNNSRTQALAWTHLGVGAVSAADVTYPAVSGDLVVVTETIKDSRRLSGLDRLTGDELWHVSLPFDRCSVAVGARQVFAWRRGIGDQRLLAAFDLFDGNLLWEWQMEGGTFSAAATGGRLVAGDSAVCWAAGSQVFLVSSRTGHLLWARQVEKRGCLSVPVVGETAVYVASAKGLYSLRLSDGASEWSCQYSRPGNPFMPPLLKSTGDRLVVGHRHFGSASQLACHDVRTGILRWQTSISDPIHSLTADRDIYVRSDCVQAFSGETGEPLWRACVSGCSPLALAEGRLYAVEGREGAHIVEIDPGTGSLLSTQYIGSSCSGLVLAGRMGFLGAHDGVLYALNLCWRG